MVRPSMISSTGKPYGESPIFVKKHQEWRADPPISSPDVEQVEGHRRVLANADMAGVNEE